MLNTEIDYKQEFLKLCLKTEHLRNTQKQCFNYDEIKRCKKKVKLTYIKINNLLDDYLKQKD